LKKVAYWGLNGVVRTAVVAAVLAGCGGGGEGGGGAPVYDPAPTPAERGPVLTVPAAKYDDALRAAAFNRINKHRQDAGIGLYKQVASLDEAAQRHSKYLVANSASGHDEKSGRDI
jgi:uncharacterized protein YkwD